MTVMVEAGADLAGCTERCTAPRRAGPVHQETRADSAPLRSTPMDTVPRGVLTSQR